MSIIIIITISIIWMLILNYYITWYYLLYLKYFDIFTYPLAVLCMTLLLQFLAFLLFITNFSMFF